MFFVYNLLVYTVGFFLKLAAGVSPKLKLFVDGRRGVFQTISQKISPTNKTIWFHAASLGEYEQGLPVMEAVKKQFPYSKIVLTFFSPSGFEVRKNNAVADVTVYLPLDTATNAKRFLDLVNPQMALFIKYEYWPNYLRELQKRRVKTYLVSGILREGQVFFKWYGRFYRRALEAFTHFFVQNQKSKELLARLGKHNVTVSGDTRFDRVAAILEKDNHLDFISRFAGDALTVVAGSTWPKDEEILVPYINQSKGVKFILAPHNIKPAQIESLKNSIVKKTVLFSQMDGQTLEDFDVFIADTIGILTKIYSYANIAYVGGGFGNPGVHNVLEPAAFGVPVIIGPNYQHFAEATALVNNGGCISVNNQQSLDEALDNLMDNDDVRHEKGHIARTFVDMNKNATQTILKHLADEGDV